MHCDPMPANQNVMPVLVDCRVLRISRKTFTLDYVVRDGATGTVFATARSTQVAYDLGTRRARVLSAAERALLTDA